MGYAPPPPPPTRRPGAYAPDLWPFTDCDYCGSASDNDLPRCSQCGAPKGGLADPSPPTAPSQKEIPAQPDPPEPDAFWR